MQNDPDRQLSDADVNEMLIEVEARELQRFNGHKKPYEFYRRRAAIRLDLMPLPEMAENELVWRLCIALAKGGAGC